MLELIWLIKDNIKRIMRKVLGRGLNIAAQINPTRNNLKEFTQIQALQGVSVKKIGCGYLQSYYLLQDGQFLKSGYFMDSLASIRVFNFYRTIPYVIRFLQKMTFLGQVISYRGGDENLSLLNKTQMMEGKGFVDAEMSGSRCFGWDANGDAYAVGENYFSQLGTRNCVNHEFSFTKIQPINGKSILKVGCGYQHTLFILENLQVFGCGKATEYQIVLMKYAADQSRVTEKIQTPDLVMKGIRAKKVCGGLKYSLILTEDDEIYSFGDNRFGQCGFNPQHMKEVRVPTLVNFLSKEDPEEKIIDLVCGYCHSLILTNKYLYFMGSIEQNQNPFSQFSENICSPTIIDLPSRAIKVFANFDRSAIITKDGKGYVFGGLDFSYCGGESGKLEILEGYGLNQKSEIGLGFAHTILMA